MKFEIWIADLFRDNTLLPALVENAASRPRQIILALARKQIAGNQGINGIGHGVEPDEQTTPVRQHVPDQRRRGGNFALEMNEALAIAGDRAPGVRCFRSEEHTSELQSLMRISYAVFCLKKKIKNTYNQHILHTEQEQTQSE